MATALSNQMPAAEKSEAKPKLAERPIDAKSAPINISYISNAKQQQHAPDSEGVTKN